jgi:hypothetical protein
MVNSHQGDSLQSSLRNHLSLLTEPWPSPLYDQGKVPTHGQGEMEHLWPPFPKRAQLLQLQHLCDWLCPPCPPPPPFPLRSNSSLPLQPSSQLLVKENILNKTVFQMKRRVTVFSSILGQGNKWWARKQMDFHGWQETSWAGIGRRVFLPQDILCPVHRSPYFTVRTATTYSPHLYSPQL